MSNFFALPRLIGAAVLTILSLTLIAVAIPASSLAASGPLPLQVNPSPAVFPLTTVGEKSNLEIEIVNPGETASIEKIAIEGSAAPAFTSSGNTCATLAEGQKCTLTVTFMPGESGAKSATAAIRFVGPERPEETFELEGSAVPASLSLSPPNLDFGVQPVNSGSAEAVLTVENDGEAPTQVNFAGFSGNSNGFGLDSNPCNNRLLQPTETCTIRVFFGPNEERPYSVQLQVNAAGQLFTAEIAGEGVRPEVEVTPNPVEFGSAPVGAGGPVKTVTLENTGVIPVGFFIAVVSGGDVGSFHLVEENCTGAELQPGDSCTAEVRFAPLSAGPRVATLSMFGNGEGAMQIPLLGDGVPASVTVTPGSHDFGSGAVGSRSRAASFAVRNAGTSPVELGAVAILGADLDQFTLSSDTCDGTTLGAGEECRVGVRFAPDGAGAKTATLRIAGDAGPLSVALGGTATAPPTAGRVSFGWRAVAGRIRRGTTLRVGTARCSSDSGCRVAVAIQLRLVPRRGAGKGTVRTRALPTIRLRLGPGRSRKLDVVLPRSVRGLLDGGRATVRTRVSWTAGDRQGRAGMNSKLR